MRKGDKVLLTTKGVDAYRQENGLKVMATAAALTAVTAGAAAPALLGGAVGVAGAFGAVGVSTAAAGAAGGAAAGGAAGGVIAALAGVPGGGQPGKIVDIRDRWWGQPGSDCEVKWPDGTKTWHRDKHLKLV